MNLDSYPLTTDIHHEAFEFFSEGPKGRIKKVVLFQKIGVDFYNLAFGDWDQENKKINDKARSNNADREMVLSTIAVTIMDFMIQHPEAMVFCKGSTTARTRMYQMALFANWKAVKKQFRIDGFSEGEWRIVKPDSNYEAFVISAR